MPLVSDTVWPVDTAVALMMMSALLVPTVRPETITVPALLRISAKAAVPVPEAVAVNGVPEIVRTAPATVPGVDDSVKLANTPVAPDNDDVPITSVPAEAAPVDDAATFDAIKSATNCIRLLLSVAL